MQLKRVLTPCVPCISCCAKKSRQRCKDFWTKLNFKKGENNPNTQTDGKDESNYKTELSSKGKETVKRDTIIRGKGKIASKSLNQETESPEKKSRESAHKAEFQGGMVDTSEIQEPKLYTESVSLHAGC